MAESQPETEKQDSLEDSLSSEDWTIIDKKESKGCSDASEEEQDDAKKTKEPKETVVTDDACQSEERVKNEIEQVEEGEEAGEEGGEKDVESDDVSILSDESEAEITFEVEGKIEKLNWQVDNLRRQPSQLKVLPSQPQPDGSSTSNTLITCSVVALIFGVIIAGQIVEFQKEKPSYSNNNEIEVKLRELNVIEEKLKELNEVKKAIDQLRLSIPDIKKSKDQLTHQKNGNFNPKLSAEEYKNIENLNLNNILDFKSFNDIHSYNNRLEMVEATYYNFCSMISKINATNSFPNPGLCETPKVLSELIVFKKNLKQAFEETQKSDSSDKRFFISVDRILDSISESLLSEVSVMFSKFSMKIQESFSRLETKVNKRLCSINNRGKASDNFFNILIDNDLLRNKCSKDSSNSESVVIDVKSNTTWKKEKNNENKKRVKYEDFKKNGYKYDHKNVKDRKNKNVRDSSREVDDDDDDDDENSEEVFDAKSKGDLKNDNWKKNKYDSKERYSKEERKSNRVEKYTNNQKSNERFGSENDFDNSYERNDQDYNKNFETKRERYYDQKFGSKKEYDADRKFEKKDSNNEYINNRKKRDRDYILDQDHYSDEEFEYKKRDREFDSQERRKKYNDYNKKDIPDRKPEFNKKDQNVESKFNNYRGKSEDDFNNEHENKRRHNYYDEDSKFNVYLEKNENEFLKNVEDKQKVKKDKEYIIRPENFKESKYSKYEGKDYKKNKYYPDGEWQMQRGKSRENLRNSDWYFVRADSRRKTASMKKSEEEEEEEKKAPQPPTPPLRPSPPPQRQQQQQDRASDDEKKESNKKESFRKRLFRKMTFIRNTFFGPKQFKFKLPFW